jgi:hypothetical protein
MQKFSDSSKGQVNHKKKFGLGAGKDIIICWHQSLQSRRRILSNIPLIKILFRCDRDKKNNQGKEKQILLKKMTDLRN